MSACNCKLCLRTQQFRLSLEKVPESEREFWSNIYSDLFHVEVDRDYYKAIVEGTWPDADQIINRHRQNT